MATVTCENLNEIVHAYVYNDQPIDDETLAAIRGHLRECASCAASAANFFRLPLAVVRGQRPLFPVEDDAILNEWANDATRGGATSPER